MDAISPPTTPVAADSQGKSQGSQQNNFPRWLPTPCGLRSRGCAAPPHTQHPINPQHDSNSAIAANAVRIAVLNRRDDSVAATISSIVCGRDTTSRGQVDGRSSPGSASAALDRLLPGLPPPYFPPLPTSPPSAPGQRQLGNRLIHLRHCRLIECALFHIPNDAHNGDGRHRAVKSIAHFHAHTDRVFAMEVGFGKRLADDGHQGSASLLITIFKITAADQRNMQRLEILPLHKIG